MVNQNYGPMGTNDSYGVDDAEGFNRTPKLPEGEHDFKIDMVRATDSTFGRFFIVEGEVNGETYSMTFRQDGQFSKNYGKADFKNFLTAAAGKRPGNVDDERALAGLYSDRGVRAVMSPQQPLHGRKIRVRCWFRQRKIEKPGFEPLRGYAFFPAS